MSKIITTEQIDRIMALCSNRHHTADPRAGERNAAIIRDIELVIENVRDHPLPQSGIARDGIEARYGLNDTWPGDPYP